MLSLRNFNELLYLRSFFAVEARYCYRFEEKDGKKILTNIDHKRTRQCHMRAHAVEAALKCLIAKYPAPHTVYVCASANHRVSDCVLHA